MNHLLFANPLLTRKIETFNQDTSSLAYTTRFIIRSWAKKITAVETDMDMQHMGPIHIYKVRFESRKYAEIAIPNFFAYKQRRKP